MNWPLTGVLVKIFARGFYRVHSGFLLFLFVTVITYCFFINVLNETHIPPDERILYNLILVLTFVSAPIMVILIFAIWLIYTIKSWKYIEGQLAIPANQFLFYSSTAYARSSQFVSWFVVQLIILLPILVYVLFTLIVGIIFNFYLVPAISLVFVITLALISALIYVSLANRPVDVQKQTYLLKLVNRWRKPYFSLFVYHIFDKLKLTFFLTKILSWSMMMGVIHLLADEHRDLRLAGFAMLGVTIPHAILIYQSQKFESTYLSFSRNFPYTRLSIFLKFFLLVSILILPEVAWMFSRFNVVIAFESTLFGLGVILLFRSLLYLFGLNMNIYLQWIFGLFIVFFLIILFNQLFIVGCALLIVSFVIFYRSYYN